MSHMLVAAQSALRLGEEAERERERERERGASLRSQMTRKYDHFNKGMSL